MCCFDLCIRGACCCCQALCNDSCRYLKRFFTLSIRQQMRLAYLSLFGFFVAFVLSIMNFAPSWLGLWSRFLHCPEVSLTKDDSLACIGVSALYRMGASLVVLFGILLLLCLLHNESSKFFNENFWFHKTIGLIGLFFAQMWISNDTYQLYSYFGQIGGVIFAIFEIVMVIDLAYSLSETWVNGYEQGYAIYEYLLYGFSLAAYSATIWLMISIFQTYPDNFSLNLSNLIVFIIASIVNLSPLNKKPNILTCGLVSLFATYLYKTGLASSQTTIQEFDFHLESYIGIGVIILSLGYITFGDSNKENTTSLRNTSNDLMASMRKSEEEDEEEEDFLENDDLEESAEDAAPIRKKVANKKGSDPQEITSNMIRNELMKIRQSRQQRRMRDYLTNTYVYFHLIMVMSSFYIVALLTNFGALSINETISWQSIPSNSTSANIKFVLSFSTYAVYIWTICAPYILQNRQF